MTALHFLYLFAIGLVVIGWGSRVMAEENVTIYGAAPPDSGTVTVSPAPAASSTTSPHSTTTHHKKPVVASQQTTTASTNTDGTAAAASAKKKTVTTHAGSTSAKTTTTHGTAKPSTTPSIQVGSLGPSSTGPVTVSKSTSTSQTQITISAPGSDKPEVETGLPVARPGSKNYTLGNLSHGAYAGSTFPLPPVVPVTSAGLSGSRGKDLLDNFNFTNFDHRTKNVYPWKINIITTEFWIGEGSTPISSTDNMASAWDQDWRSSNGGTDTPSDRNGYAPANHAAGINPFYVALPFNDLAFPDKARRWLPAGWYRPPRDGKQVSACKDRWVEIKNAQGEVCYAQWEDVGPLRYDHAEYVFGNERPDTYTRAGLDVSPAVAQYLNINEHNRITRWRFVDDADVVPGEWLKYDEEALLFKAIRASKDVLPIERARAPINDQDEIDSTQRKINKAKG